MWEWTSTVLDIHDGFVGTTIFPGYSSDFFDQKHYVVISAKLSLRVVCAASDDSTQLGDSYATTPRLAIKYGISTNTAAGIRGRRQGSHTASSRPGRTTYIGEFTVVFEGHSTSPKRGLLLTWKSPSVSTVCRALAAAITNCSLQIVHQKSPFPTHVCDAFHVLEV